MLIYVSSAVSEKSTSGLFPNETLHLVETLDEDDEELLEEELLDLEEELELLEELDLQLEEDDEELKLLELEEDEHRLLELLELELDE